jgi:hypothetical protein
MQTAKTPLNVEQLVACVEKSINSIQVFHIEDLIPSTQTDKDKYFPYKITYTLRNASQYSLFNIPIDEAHALIDDSKRIKAIFFVLDNQNLIDKMTSQLEKWKFASGVSLIENSDFSFYSWKYKGGSIGVNLNAFKFRLVEKIVRDDALIIFSNGDMKSYITIPDEN